MSSRKQNNVRSKPERNQTAKSTAVGNKIIVSKVDNAWATVTTDISLSEALNLTVHPHTSEIRKINAIRKRYWDVLRKTGSREKAKKAVNPLKEKLAPILWHGRFSTRSSSVSALDACLKYSGLVIGDLDFLGERLDEIRALLNPYAYRIFLSPTADGLKPLFRVRPEPKLHEANFRAVEKLVTKLTGLPSSDNGNYEPHFDGSGSDLRRICFPSYDPEMSGSGDLAPILEPSFEKEEKQEKQPTATDDSPLKKLVREVGESVLGWLGEWQKDERQRVFAECACPDPRRQHHPSGKTRLYLNPGGVPRIECKGGACSEAVKARNAALRDLFLARKDAGFVPRELPVIETVGKRVDDSEVVLPPDVVIDVLHREGKMMVGGGSKSRKTWQQLDLCIAVATGTEWLGRFQTVQGRVLYLNFELPRAFCEWRIQQICRHKGLSLTLNKDLLDVMHLRGHAMDVKTFVPLLIDRIEKDAYALIDVDPLYKLIGENRSENAAGDMAVVCNTLEYLAVQTGAAIVIGAHYSKGDQSEKEAIDRISGSGVLARDPDTILNFTPHEIEDAYTVSPIIRNHKPVEEFCVWWNYPVFELARGLDPKQLKGREDKRVKGQLGEKLAVLDEFGEKGATYSEYRGSVIKHFGISGRCAEGWIADLLAAKEIGKKEDRLKVCDKPF